MEPITVLKGWMLFLQHWIYLEQKSSSEPGREYILKELIENIRGSYDYIIIDSPPSLDFYKFIYCS
jgi:chromosome partitioning protein